MLNKEIILTKMFRNFQDIGMIIASRSNEPNYNYHWIRDSALVMRSIINAYKLDNDPLLFKYIIQYIENENKLQNVKTLSGLGEPKYNLNGTSFDDNWGRPQNDGPALRGIMMIKIYKLLENYNFIKFQVLSIIKKDLEYTIKNLDKPCFDLWEEKLGYHFYTRMLQLKFLKDYEKIFKTFLNYNLYDVINNFTEKINHHLEQNDIISSFNCEGEISKRYDASVFLAFTHIDFDKSIMSSVSIKLCEKNIINLAYFFKEKYSRKIDAHLIGRYENDKYYNGHIWIICSLGLAQVYLYLNRKKDAENIISFIKNIDENLDLDEQYNLDTGKQLSAKNLTWNYSELFNTYLMIS